jgi:hypothetical protein
MRGVDACPAASTSSVLHNASASRSYIAKAFKSLLIVTPLTTISALLCFANIINYWEETPRHLCNLTSYCGQILFFPILLSFLSVLGFVPTLLVLDHFLALSPLFGNKPVSSEDVTSGNPQIDSDEETPENPVPSSSHPRRTLSTLTSAAYTAATLWFMAGMIAITSAALIIKYDEPFDDRSDPKYKQRVVVGLFEAAFDLSLTAFSIRLGVLYSRARQSTPAETPSPTQGVRSLPRVSLLDVWTKVQGLWPSRASLDKPVLCLITTFGLLVVTTLFYSSSTPPTWKYFFGSYFFYTVVLTYPFLFTFHRCRATGVIPGLVARGLAIIIFSFLAFFGLSFRLRS